MQDTNNISSEVSIAVTFASFMSAVTLFFTGILIANYKSFNSSIKIPLIFLIISTFSFIFAASIYLNAATEITLNRLKIVEKYLIYSKNIVEFLGLYLFILATPLVIGAVTNDGFLQASTVVVALAGFLLYSQSRFSTLAKELRITLKRFLSLVITCLALGLYFVQSNRSGVHNFWYIFLAIVLLAIIASMTVYFSLRSKQYKPLFFRPFRSSDANVLSDIVMRNLNHLKSSHFAPAFIDQVRKESTPEEIVKLGQDQALFVAEFDDQVVGLAALEKHNISHVFTDPYFRRKGIGHMLVDYVEDEASKRNYQEVDVLATAIDRAFYKKIGYHETDEEVENHGQRLFKMRKELH